MARRGHVASLRVGELRRLFNCRYGTMLPDDDAGRGDAALMLDHLVQLHDRPHAIDNFLDAQTPWMPPAERQAIRQAASTGGARWTADALGQQLRLTNKERADLKITTIAPCDVDRRALEEIQKEKHRERERRRRRVEQRQTRRRPPISVRDVAVLETLPPHGWHALSSLQEELRGHRAFVGVDHQHMRKAINRSLRALERAGLAKTENRPGTRGLPVLFATRDAYAPHATLSPGTLTGTSRRAQR